MATALKNPSFPPSARKTRGTVSAWSGGRLVILRKAETSSNPLPHHRPRPQPCDAPATCRFLRRARTNPVAILERLLSPQINGIRQRFLTRFLEVRLVELQRHTEKKLEALQSEAIELEVSVSGAGLSGEISHFGA